MGKQIVKKRDFDYNPMGTEGFSFVEFTTPEPSQLRALFHALGFRRVGHHPNKPLYWYQQGNIRFLISEESDGFSDQFRQSHGPSACAMGFNVKNAKSALQHAKHCRAKACNRRSLELQVPAIYGIGNSLLYLVDEKGRHTIFDNYFEADTEDATASTGLLEVDHLTHNVYQGNMDQWAHFYEDIFNFHEIRYFDIKGQATGLVSRAMTSPCGKIRIPINESKDQDSQIEEYLREYNGEGIQHIALTTKNIYKTVAQLKQNGIEFLDVPDTYYEMLEDRLPQHGEDIEQLRQHRVLIDGATEDGEHRLLLQIFTETVIGPIFFEIIQRKGDEGFGEGNFKALFESIERDQIKRGVLKI